MANPTMPTLAQAPAEALGGTIHAGTGVQFESFLIDDTSIPNAFSRLKNHQNKVLTLLAASAQGLVVDLKSGLTVGVFAIKYPIGGVEKSYAGDATSTLTASATNRLYLDSAQTLKNSITAWPSGDHFKLAVVTTDATSVTSVEDRRFQNFQIGAISNWWTFPPTAAVDLNNQDLNNVGGVDLDATTTLTLDASGNLDLNGQDTFLRVDTFDEAPSQTALLVAPTDDEGTIHILLRTTAARITTIDSSLFVTNLGDMVLSGTGDIIALIVSNGLWTELFRSSKLALLTGPLDANLENITNIGQLSLAKSVSVISAGVIEITDSYVRIDTEGAAPTDELDTINGTVNWQILVLEPTSAARVVTVKHGTGNIKLANDRDYVMKAAHSRLFLQHNGTELHEIARSEWSIADLLDTADAIPYPLVVNLSGALTIKVYEINLFCPHAFTIKDVTGVVNTAPSGGACIIDIRVDGNSIFASQAEMVNIADAATQDTSAVKNHAVAAGSVLTFEVELANTAADATLMINGFIAPKAPPV